MEHPQGATRRAPPEPRRARTLNSVATARIRPADLVAVFIGGTVGALARAGVAHLWSDLPWATLLVNVIGSALLGLVAGSLRRRPDTLLHHLVAVGLLGSLTTFSTFAVEAVYLGVESSPAIALAYLGGSVFLGVQAARVGLRLGRR